MIVPEFMLPRIPAFTKLRCMQPFPRIASIHRCLFNFSIRIPYWTGDKQYSCIVKRISCIQHIFKPSGPQEINRDSAVKGGDSHSNRLPNFSLPLRTRIISLFSKLFSFLFLFLPFFLLLFSFLIPCVIFLFDLHACRVVKGIYYLPLHLAYYRSLSSIMSILIQELVLLID